MLGVRIERLLGLKYTAEFRNDLANGVRLMCVCEFPSVFESLIARAEAGDMRAISMFFKHAGLT
jgi:hypothetical protein